LKLIHINIQIYNFFLKIIEEHEHTYRNRRRTILEIFNLIKKTDEREE